MKPKFCIPFIICFGAGMVGGCGQNALLFHETTKFSFSAEYKPDSSQPMSTSLGYKRRIAAIVPPKEPVAEADRDKPEAVHKGEALSLVSLFDVDGQGVLGAKIRNYFASGMAAQKMTGNKTQAAASIGALLETKYGPDERSKCILAWLSFDQKRRNLLVNWMKKNQIPGGPTEMIYSHEYSTQRQKAVQDQELSISCP